MLFLSVILEVKLTRMSKITTYSKKYEPLKLIGESLDAQIEPNNPVDKYSVCIRKSGKVVGSLRKRTTGRFAKTIFFFLKGDPYSKAKTITSGLRCNLNDGEGLQVPCKLKFVGHRGKFTDLLHDEV